MIERLLSPVACSTRWGRQMRFIAGPRQSGKTTLARTHLKNQKDSALYYNWDDRTLRRRFHTGVDFLKEDLLQMRQNNNTHWVCYDEIHKMPKWKNILKDHFDRFEGKVTFLITGSARLDLFRHSGDSLAGRYFLFHLLPLNLFEITRKSGETLGWIADPDEFIESKLAHSKKDSQELMEDLLAYSGFPEPFLKADARFYSLWREHYLDQLIRGDLRDLTRISELENVAALISLLPERIGSPLSLNSLREDLMVNYKTVQNYIRALRISYFIFEVPPYAKKISRAIKKEKKIYFYDWTRITDLAKRFENYVAVELLNWTSLWQDSGFGDFELRYVKTRSAQECDFLILKDAKPWLLLEAKLKNQPIASYHYHFAEKLGKIPIVQLVHEGGILRMGRQRDYSVSASRFLSA